MSLIYSSTGRAREYSPLALNLYTSCDQKCGYCYTKFLKKVTELPPPKPRADILDKLQKELSVDPPREQILLSFTHDAYLNLEFDLEITRAALMMLNKANCKVAILTKAGTRIFRDMDIFEQFGDRIKIGATLTVNQKNLAMKYEPFSPNCENRIMMLKELKEHGIKTWASIEPVIHPNQSLQLMTDSILAVDQFLIGKLNHYAEIEQKINYNDFLRETVAMMIKHNKKFYIKKDLREAAPNVELPEEAKRPELMDL